MIMTRDVTSSNEQVLQKHKNYQITASLNEKWCEVLALLLNDLNFNILENIAIDNE